MCTRGALKHMLCLWGIRGRSRGYACPVAVVCTARECTREGAQGGELFTWLGRLQAVDLGSLRLLKLLQVRLRKK